MNRKTCTRFLSSFLTLSMIFLLCACGGQSDQSSGGKTISEKDVREHAEVNIEDLEVSIQGDECSVVRYFGDDDIVVIPEQINGNKVTHVEAMAFNAGASGAVRGVMLPDTVTELDRTFIDSTELQVVICEGVENIGFASFAHCGKLHTVVTGSNLKTIGESAFCDCTSLVELSIESDTATLDENVAGTVFAGCSDKLYVSVKSDSELAKQCADLDIPTSKAAADANAEAKEIEERAKADSDENATADAETVTE